MATFEAVLVIYAISGCPTILKIRLQLRQQLSFEELREVVSSGGMPRKFIPSLFSQLQQLHDELRNQPFSAVSTPLMLGVGTFSALNT